MPLILPVVIKPPTTQQTLSSSKKVIRFIILCRCGPIYFQTFRFEYKIPGAIEIWKWSPHQHASNTRDDRQEIPPQRDLDRFEGSGGNNETQEGTPFILDSTGQSQESTWNYLKTSVCSLQRRPKTTKGYLQQSIACLPHRRFFSRRFSASIIPCNSDMELPVTCSKIPDGYIMMHRPEPPIDLEKKNSRAI